MEIGKEIICQEGSPELIDIHSRLDFVVGGRVRE